MGVSVRPQEGHSCTLDELIGMARGGDETAQRTIFDRLVPTFSNFFKARTGGGSSATEELATDAATEVLEALTNGKYESDRGSFVSFAYGVARKVRLRHLKTQQRSRMRGFSELSSHESEWIAKQNIEAEDGAAALEQIEAMTSCLLADGGGNALTPCERYVVTQRALRKTFQVLANELRCSLDTVHRLQGKALAKLRRCMEGKGFN